uniref:Macro domain-containing protein n=1 Tax=Mastacembelus armatus TaxID=205130 RepID=A0A3Q3LZF0_9TELE
MASTIAIPLHESSLHIVKQCGPILNNALQSKFGSLATFDGVNFEKDHGIALLKKPVVAPEKRFSVKLYQGVNLSVWKADLTNFPVDAVVNAANEHLQHYGGLADALSSAGGPQIQKDCNDYITKNGSLRTGDAIVCDAGLLPCKKIIHAVGPKLPLHPSASDVSSAEWYLKKAISNILDEVRKNQLKTVAIPAISSGLFNYPLPQCKEVAQIMSQAVANFAGNFQNKMEVYFVIFPSDRDTFKVVLQKCCPDIRMLYVSCQNTEVMRVVFIEK